MTFLIGKKGFKLFIILILTMIPALFQVDSTKFDSYVQKALEDWDVPALSVAVVKKDFIVFLKAYGSGST